MSKRQQKIDAAVEAAVKRAMNPEILRQMTEVAQDVAKRAFTEEIVHQIQHEALANIAADPNVIGVVRGLAYDTAEDAAKAYVMHVLGARITIELAAAVDGVPHVVPPINPQTL